MQDLIKEYRETLKLVRKLKEKAPVEDRRILASMDSDIRYCLQWMRTARRPGSRRGVERLAAYQREKSFDPILIQEYVYGLDKDERSCLRFDPYSLIDDDEKHNMISESDRERIETALSILSPLEREVYLMSRGKCISYKNIGKMLGIKETTVANKIERAEKKLARFRKEASVV